MFNTSSFIIDQRVADEFIRAPVVTVEEALGSLEKRRVSVRGKVADVSIGDC